MGNCVQYLVKRITTGTFYSHNSGFFQKASLTDYSINMHPAVLVQGMGLVPGMGSDGAQPSRTAVLSIRGSLEGH